MSTCMMTSLFSSCVLYARFASGAFMNSMNGQGFNPIVVRQEGLFQLAANQFCHDKAAGARLVTINDQTENDFLYEWVIRMMLQPEPVWIGLHTNAMGQWSWFSGEPVNFTNWEQGQYVPPEPGMGAMLFDADPVNQMNNQVDITAQWVPEQARNEPHFLMCEYRPQGMTAAGTVAPAATAATTGAATTATGTVNPQNPQNPQNPALYSNWNRPMNLGNFFGGRFGGSQLQEVGRRPANYRMNPYYAMP